MQNSKCKIQNAKFKMQNAKCKIQNSKLSFKEIKEIWELSAYAYIILLKLP